MYTEYVLLRAKLTSGTDVGGDRTGSRYPLDHARNPVVACVSEATIITCIDYPAGFYILLVRCTLYQALVQRTTEDWPRTQCQTAEHYRRGSSIIGTT